MFSTLTLAALLLITPANAQNKKKTRIAVPNRVSLTLPGNWNWILQENTSGEEKPTPARLVGAGDLGALYSSPDMLAANKIPVALTCPDSEDELRLLYTSLITKTIPANTGKYFEYAPVPMSAAGLRDAAVAFNTAVGVKPNAAVTINAAGGFTKQDLQLVLMFSTFEIFATAEYRDCVRDSVSAAGLDDAYYYDRLLVGGALVLGLQEASGTLKAGANVNNLVNGEVELTASNRKLEFYMWGLPGGTLSLEKILAPLAPEKKDAVAAVATFRSGLDWLGVVATQTAHLK
jgi:hypothetical protein